LAEGHPERPDYIGAQGMALGNLGWLMLQDKSVGWLEPPDTNPLKARQHLESGIGLLPTALERNATNRTYTRAPRDQHEYLADALLRLGEHAEAARIARALPNILQESKDSYTAATLLARCARVAERDTKLVPADRQARVVEYGRQSLRLLEQALDRGQ